MYLMNYKMKVMNWLQIVTNSTPSEFKRFLTQPTIFYEVYSLKLKIPIDTGVT